MFTGTLLPYQEEAVDKMCARGKMLVAYDLGLGKTVLTIAAIERIRSSQAQPFVTLVVCLSSLKYQWASQIKRFTDGANVLVVDGTPKQRQNQYSTMGENDYVIMNYEQVVKDWGLLHKFRFTAVVIDEATAIKSFKSKRSKIIKHLEGDYKFALTGTPVENGKAEELFSIMQFVDSKVLGSYPSFEAKYIVRNYFGGVDRYKNLEQLNSRLSAACVRKRQKDPDVSPYLPTTIMAEPILVPLDSASKKLYNSISTELLADLDEAAYWMDQGFNIFANYIPDDGPLDELRGRIMPKLLAMRQLCSHPGLLDTSANLFINSRLGTEGSSYAADLKLSDRLPKNIKTPKLDVLKETVDNFLGLDPNNKVVIFSSFVNMTNIITAELSEYKAVVYNGTMNAKEKENAKVNFQTDPSIRVLVSSDAGGYGVDLPQANLLINYDLPWNAGLALQRNGRIQRASSTWEKVVIQDILIAGSIEERQYEMLQQKMSVANAIVDNEGLDATGSLSLTLGSLRQFLQLV
jgi:SNF2 family DNA or RNA helicase